MKSTERGDKCRQRPWGLVCHFSICLNSCSWSRAKGDKRIQQLNHSYWGNHCFVVFFFFFSSFFCFRTSRSKGAGYVTGCSANYFIAPACWALLQWKHLKFCPWSRELDHTTVLLWNFFFFFFVEDHLRSEKMPWAGSKRVTWAVCCWCLSTKLTLPAPMGVPGAETADCQLPGTVLSRLLCQINIDLNRRSLELCLSLPFKHVLLFCFLQSK